jgi:nucleotide-binding universal stress UspA family protein
MLANARSEIANSANKLMGLSFSSVVFATDFSTSVRTAGRYAALFAQHFDAELIVVHAFTPLPAAEDAKVLGHVRSVQREHLEHLLSETVKELTPPARRSATVLGEGSPVDLIRGLFEQHEPNLIVLGTHGGGAIERHLLGSVAEGILRAIRGPILTVGPHVAVPSSARLEFRHILYATDFSAAAAHAASYAFALGRAFGSDIDVLHVVSAEATARYDVAEREQELLGELDKLVPEDARELCRPRNFVEFGDAHECIINHAHERSVDLIVLGAHQHSHLAMHFRTGPAFQVIVKAPCPVLTTCL